MTTYSHDPGWEDIIPLPQDDGDNPLAQIAYTDEYSEAMSYLRAIMAKEEMSDRALKITEHIIKINPAHYTVWYDASSESRWSLRCVDASTGCTALW